VLPGQRQGSCWTVIAVTLATPSPWEGVLSKVTIVTLLGRRDGMGAW